MYSFTVDHERRIVHATFSGLFTKDEVAAFGRDEQVAARSLGCPSDEFGLLLDAREGIAQSQEVVASFQALLPQVPLRAGRVAVVTSGALLKLQVRRIVQSERLGVFDTIDEAERWIAEGLPPIR